MQNFYGLTVHFIHSCRVRDIGCKLCLCVQSRKPGGRNLSILNSEGVLARIIGIQRRTWKRLLCRRRPSTPTRWTPVRTRRARFAFSSRLLVSCRSLVGDAFEKDAQSSVAVPASSTDGGSDVAWTSAAAARPRLRAAGKPGFGRSRTRQSGGYREWGG